MYGPYYDINNIINGPHNEWSPYNGTGHAINCPYYEQSILCMVHIMT